MRQWLNARILNLGYGPQRVLAIADMTTDNPRTGPAAPSLPAQELDADTVQPLLIESKELATGTIHTPAKSKRPRTRKPTRRTWGAL